MIVDDVPDVARVIEMIVNREEDLETVGTLHSCERIVEEVRDRRAEVVVMDLTMPGETRPLDAIRAVTQSDLHCRVIAYSGHDDEETFNSATQAGAAACVSKHRGIELIITAIRNACRIDGAEEA